MAYWALARLSPLPHLASVRWLAAPGGAAEFSGCAPALSDGGASDRGAGWLGGGAPLPTVSMATAFLSAPPPVPIIARVACCTTSVALVIGGSTSVGSPPFAACSVSGRLEKFLITCLYIGVSRRLSSSLLLSAIACLVGRGIG